MRIISIQFHTIADPTRLNERVQNIEKDFILSVDTLHDYQNADLLTRHLSMYDPMTGYKR